MYVGHFLGGLYFSCLFIVLLLLSLLIYLRLCHVLEEGNLLVRLLAEVTEDAEDEPGKRQVRASIQFVLIDRALDLL